MQDVDGTNITNFISPSGCSNTRLASIDSALLAWVTGDLPNTRCVLDPRGLSVGAFYYLLPLSPSHVPLFSYFPLVVCFVAFLLSDFLCC